MSSLKRTSTKSFQIELVTKYDTNGAKRELCWGGPNLRRGIHIRLWIWTWGCRNVEVMPECWKRAGMFKSCRKVELVISFVSQILFAQAFHPHCVAAQETKCCYLFLSFFFFFFTLYLITSIKWISSERIHRIPSNNAHLSYVWCAFINLKETRGLCVT